MWLSLSTEMKILICFSSHNCRSINSSPAIFFPWNTDITDLRIRLMLSQHTIPYIAYQHTIRQYNIFTALFRIEQHRWLLKYSNIPPTSSSSPIIYFFFFVHLKYLFKSCKFYTYNHLGKHACITHFQLYNILRRRIDIYLYGKSSLNYTVVHIIF